jgi:transposase
MTMKKFEISINLPGVDLTGVEEHNNEILFWIEPTDTCGRCHSCNTEINKYHGQDRERKLRHLPILGKPTYIIYKARRYFCDDCNKASTMTGSWHKRNSQCTLDYENHVLMEIINSTVRDVAIKQSLTEAAVMGIIGRHIESEVDWATVGCIDVLGMDEISLKKGRNQFVTIITSRHEGNIKLLAVFEGHKKATIKAFLNSIPWHLKKTVTAVCTDMYDGYVSAAKEVFKKKTLVVIDRFHIAKLYRGELDRYRQKILKQLKSELPDREYKKLSGTMHVLRGNNECLTKEEKEKLNHLFSNSPELAEAYRLAIKLTQIFNTHTERSEALKKIRSWVWEVRRSQLPCFNTFLNTLEKYQQEIANYFIDRNSSGFVEGFNNKVKVLKRRCYGIFNLKHFFQRLHLDVSGYSIFLGKSAG